MTYTRSYQVYNFLREWLRMPFCDRRKILERQDGVAMAARADNLDFLTSIVKYLRKIHDLPRLILKIKKVGILFSKLSTLG